MRFQLQMELHDPEEVPGDVLHHEEEGAGEVGVDAHGGCHPPHDVGVVEPEDEQDLAQHKVGEAAVRVGGVAELLERDDGAAQRVPGAVDDAVRPGADLQQHLELGDAAAAAQRAVDAARGGRARERPGERVPAGGRSGRLGAGIGGVRDRLDEIGGGGR